MKIIHKNNIMGILEGKLEVQRQLRILQDNNWFRDQIKQEIDINYNELIKGTPVIQETLQDNWERLFAVLEYEPFGKKILDLGCGASNNNIESKIYPLEYEPWLCRSLYFRSIPITTESRKIQIIGIDCGDLSKEAFPHKELNLFEKDILINNFEKNSFDLINASMLFNSPELERKTNGKDGSEDASEETAINLKNILLPQIKQLLKPDGIFLYCGGEKELFWKEPEYVEHFRNSNECKERLRPKERYSFGGQY